MRRSTLLLSAALMLNAVAVTAAAAAQGPQSSAIEGRVTDDSGGVLVDAVGTGSRVESLIGGPRTSKTDSTGRYRFVLLPPGDYDVVAANGNVGLNAPGHHAYGGDNRDDRSHAGCCAFCRESRRSRYRFAHRHSYGVLCNYPRRATASAYPDVPSNRLCSPDRSSSGCDREYRFRRSCWRERHLCRRRRCHRAATSGSLASSSVQLAARGTGIGAGKRRAIWRLYRRFGELSAALGRQPVFGTWSSTGRRPRSGSGRTSRMSARAKS